MLELENVFLTFNRGTVNEKKVFEDLSLKVSDGDFITIVGANGSGKSTLFNLIAGSLIPDSGKVVLNGKDVTLSAEYKRARKIGRLFQDPLAGTAPDMSIVENLALADHRGGWLSRIREKDREFFATRLRELNMGLEDRLDTPAGLLSGGQRQALALMMATIDPPEILLLDEHTAALDPGSADKVMAITREIVDREKLTCLMITHNMYSALDCGNRTLVIDNGSVVLDIQGEERKRYTVNDMLEHFRRHTGKPMSDDEILLI